MAHFAKINEDGIVVQVCVVDNENINNLEFPSSEPVGQAFLSSLGLGGEWKQTSYNAQFRGVYAGENYAFDAVNDVFVAPVAPPEE